MRKVRIAIAAGGTGGHLFPAGEVARALLGAGAEVHLITDSRGKRFARGFWDAHTIVGGQWSGEGIFRRLATLVLLCIGCVQSMWILLRLRPRAVIGMGGYISVPPIVCGRILGRRTVIFNADSVLGNANGLLRHFADKVALAFADTKGAPNGAVVVGLPLRADMARAARTRYNPLGALAVMGGSQGAQIFSNIVPKAIGLLPADVRRGLKIYQQVVAEDLGRVRAEYRRLGVEAECRPFFTDSAGILAGARLFIGRAGANTVYEIGCVGRPAVFIPIEHKDQQQVLNAQKIAGAGGAEILRQKDATPEALAGLLARLLGDKRGLAKMAARAKIFRAHDAARKIAAMSLG